MTNRRAIVFAALCSIMWPATLMAQARNGFTDETLHDRYAFHVLALSLALPNVTTGASVPFAVAGYYSFNGNGTLTGKDTVSTQGQIIERSYTGTYHVNGDGTGWLKLNISPSFKPLGRFTIVNNGIDIEIIFAVPGNLNTFTLHQQSPN
jgi:hypothetical protein